MLLSVARTKEYIVLVVDSFKHAETLCGDNTGAFLKPLDLIRWEVTVPLLTPLKDAQ